MKTLIFIFFIQILLSIVSSDPDYYWKDFDGTFPKDAFVAGTNSLGQKIYIGNVHVGNSALFVGPIIQGEDFVTVTGKSEPVFKLTKNVKILCTQTEKLEWVSATYQTFHEIPYHLVEGGYENSENNMLYIGKTMDKGEIKIGKVAGYGDTTPGIMYYAVGSEEASVKSYDILIYV